jgi:hypothetical protein
MLPGREAGLFPASPDLAEAAQHLAGDAIVFHDRIPVAQAADLPLDHEGPDPLGRFMDEVGPPGIPVCRLLRNIKAAQRRQSLLDLSAEVSEGLGLLLVKLVVQHAPPGLRLEGAR